MNNRLAPTGNLSCHFVFVIESINRLTLRKALGCRLLRTPHSLIEWVGVVASPAVAHYWSSPKLKRPTLNLQMACRIPPQSSKSFLSLGGWGSSHIKSICKYYPVTCKSMQSKSKTYDRLKRAARGRHANPASWLKSAQAQLFICHIIILWISLAMPVVEMWLCTGGTCGEWGEH